MRFEVIEYVKDENGNNKVSATYEIETREVGKTVERLDAEIKSGRLSDAAISPV